MIPFINFWWFGSSDDDDYQEKEEDEPEDEEENIPEKECIFQCWYNENNREWDCSLTGDEDLITCQLEECPFQKIIKLLEKKDEEEKE